MHDAAGPDRAHDPSGPDRAHDHPAQPSEQDRADQTHAYLRLLHTQLHEARLNLVANTRNPRADLALLSDHVTALEQAIEDIAHHFAHHLTPTK